MKEITVALVRGTSWISRMIKWQTRSEYSHAAVVLEDGRTVIEAWEREGVRQYRPTSVEWMDQMDFFKVRVTDDQAERLYAWLRRRVGAKYDYKSVLRFVSRRKSMMDSKWFCSELVFRAFEMAGVNLLARTKAWRVSPGLLARSPLLILK